MHRWKAIGKPPDNLRESSANPPKTTQEMDGWLLGRHYLAVRAAHLVPAKLPNQVNTNENQLRFTPSTRRADADRSSAR